MNKLILIALVLLLSLASISSSAQKKSTIHKYTFYLTEVYAEQNGDYVLINQERQTNSSISIDKFKVTINLHKKSLVYQIKGFYASYDKTQWRIKCENGVTFILDKSLNKISQFNVLYDNQMIVYHLN